MIMTAICLLTVNTMALEFSLFPPAGFSYPDFDAMDSAFAHFEETVDTLRNSDEVYEIVDSVESIEHVTCVALNGKESAGFKWYKLPYKCEGSKDFKLTIKARIKKGEVLIKDYKMK